MRRTLLWCLPFAAALALTSAYAQDRPLLVQPYAGPYEYGPDFGFDYGHGIGYPGVPVDALPTPFSHGGSCVKLCAYDQSPCDPDYWKVADRRCNYNQRG